MGIDMVGVMDCFGTTCLRILAFIYPSRIFPDAVEVSQHSLGSSISVSILVESLKPCLNLGHKARKAVSWS